MNVYIFFLLGLLCSTFALAPLGPWDQFNFAPESKTVYPTAIHSSHGTVQNAQRLVANMGSATLSGKGTWVALDYGREVRPLGFINFSCSSVDYFNRLEASSQ